MEAERAAEQSEARETEQPVSDCAGETVERVSLDDAGDRDAEGQRESDCERDCPWRRINPKVECEVAGDAFA
ncbi:MAG: hypothetical protein WAL31_08980 [Gaiellaceae bacterium]